MNKYHARRTVYHDFEYDSAAEAGYAARLDYEVRAGTVERWHRGDAQVLIEGPSRDMRVTYKPDFIVYYPGGKVVAIDVKGFVPRDFRIRAILWMRKFPNLPLSVVDKDGNQKWPKPKKIPVLKPITRTTEKLHAEAWK